MGRRGCAARCSGSAKTPGPGAKKRGRHRDSRWGHRHVIEADTETLPTTRPVPRELFCTSGKCPVSGELPRLSPPAPPRAPRRTCQRRQQSSTTPTRSTETTARCRRLNEPHGFHQALSYPCTRQRQRPFEKKSVTGALPTTKRACDSKDQIW